jgi:hypothetical protein
MPEMTTGDCRRPESPCCDVGAKSEDAIEKGALGSPLTCFPFAPQNTGICLGAKLNPYPAYMANFFDTGELLSYFGRSC